jgi:RimJ/RimL family protein N-acetyltransferase
MSPTPTVLIPRLLCTPPECGHLSALEQPAAVMEALVGLLAEMRLHRIEARTIADNHRSVRLLERLGFQREGTLREYSWEDDLAFHDSAVYGLLSTDR